MNTMSEKDTPLMCLLYDTIIEFNDKHPYKAHNKEDVTVLLPQPFLYLLKHELLQLQASGPTNIAESSSFNCLGYELKVGYEMAIVVYHKDCTAYLENVPIVKVPLMPGVSLPNKETVYNRVLFKMQKINFNNNACQKSYLS